MRDAESLVFLTFSLRAHALFYLMLPIRYGTGLHHMDLMELITLTFVDRYYVLKN